MESQYKSIISFETELESEINKLNEMKEKIERKKREIENMLSPAPWAERSDERLVSKNVEISTEVVPKKKEDLKNYLIQKNQKNQKNQKKNQRKWDDLVNMLQMNKNENGMKKENKV